MNTRRIHGGCGILVGLALLALAGCKQEGGLQDWVKRKFFGPSPRQMVAMAFDPNDADRRREGITLLSGKRWGLRDPHLKGFAVLLASDEDPTVRSAAARALGKAGDIRYLPDLVAALDRPRQPDAVRWDCAVALDKVVGDQAVPSLRKHATDDAYMDVRIACARALRHFRRQEAVRALLVCLSDPAFEVRHEAHASLVAITGVDQGYEPQQWAAVTGVKLPPPSRKTRRAWWDWFGVRSRRAAADRKDAGGGKEQARARPDKAKRPWWDWFGVSKPDRPTDAKAAAPETAPAKPKPTPKPKRPWWDWFGVTGKGSGRKKPASGS